MKRQIVATAAALALLVPVFVFTASSKMPDFEVYWRAGARALAAEPLYRAEDEHYQLKYLPAFAVLAIPLSLVPLSVAKGAWFLASAALIALLLTQSLTILPARHRPSWVLIIVTLLAMAKFYGHELVLGQVNLLFATLIVTTVRCMTGGRPFTAGLLVALAIVIKPYGVIFVPWLAAMRAGAALAAALAGTAAAALLPVAIYGLERTLTLHLEWWRTVTESTAPNLLNADNASLAGMYAKWLGPDAAAVWFTLVSSIALLAAAAIVFLQRRHVEKPAGLESALLLMLIPLLSPQGWDYVFLVSTPAVMYVVNYDRQLPPMMRTLTWAALAVAAFSLYDVMGRQAYAVFMAWSVITVCYLMVVFTLGTLRARRVA